MINIDKVEKIYLACGYTDLRKSIDGLVMTVKNQFKLHHVDKALFVFETSKWINYKIFTLMKDSCYIIRICRRSCKNPS